VFGRASTPLSLGWTNYYSTANVISIPGIYAGQTIAVNYHYRDVCRVTQSDSAWTQGNQWSLTPKPLPWVQVTALYVDNDQKLADGNEIDVYKVRQDLFESISVISATIVHIDRGTHKVILNGTISSDDPRYAYFIFLKPDASQSIDDRPLQRAAGELHTVPAPMNGISHVRLKHLPAAGTTLTVRGASVVIRALWTQPRSGQAYIVDNDSAFSFPTKLRTINERWRAKTAIINLPIGED
jgi:hypothetical protein